MFLTADGAVWTCGKANKCGVLGRGSDAPLNLATVTLSGSVEAVACGDKHTLLLTAAGEVYSFGDNSSGQCGTGSGSEAVNVPEVTALRGHVVGMS